MVDVGLTFRLHERQEAEQLVDRDDFFDDADNDVVLRQHLGSGFEQRHFSSLLCDSKLVSVYLFYLPPVCLARFFRPSAMRSVPVTLSSRSTRWALVVFVVVLPAPGFTLER
ncbi:hypothetical protein D3C87_1866550 [compost metagenome]